MGLARCSVSSAPHLSAFAGSQREHVAAFAIYAWMWTVAVDTPAPYQLRRLRRQF